MQKPKMIMFDYGNTLVYEPVFDGLLGTEALLKQAVGSKVDPKEFNDLCYKLYDMGREARESCVELPISGVFRFALEYLGVELDMSLEDVEYINWENSTPSDGPMEHMAETLKWLRENGFRTSVLSNNSFQGKCIKRRLDKLLPDHEFEFIISTADYMVRKPNSMIFELALRKAKLAPNELWYCGDSPEFDLIGAAGAGIYPVWYHSSKPCYYKRDNPDDKPEQGHLYIRDWPQLVEALS